MRTLREHRLLALPSKGISIGGAPARRSSKIGPFFTWCVRESIILENPCTKVVKQLNFDDGPPAIFSVEDTARLLNEAQSIDPLIAKYLAIGLFAGMKIL